ncbi:MAG: 16S rRNA (guanine(527)-N(7))-methyltransferase RsmG [Actinomycetota bacterium]|nr:16S rRNA (guanine(527)-N(7))-methyltransferase RsmG [Actinomycetota bacterium]
MERWLVELVKKYSPQDWESKVEKLEQYVRLLEAKRKWGNLASRALVEKPSTALADSIEVARLLEPAEHEKVVDVGSGGGLLGLVVAVMCPRVRVSLVEPNARKCTFLAEAIGSLGIPNAEVVCSRIEGLPVDPSFDAAITRATGKLEVMVGRILPVVRKGGIFVSVKGPGCESEIASAQDILAKAGGEILEVRRLFLEGKDGELSEARASLVVIRKVKASTEKPGDVESER